jgi:hypothetical protein
VLFESEGSFGWDGIFSMTVYVVGNGQPVMYFVLKVWFSHEKACREVSDGGGGFGVDGVVGERVDIVSEYAAIDG